MKTDQINCVVIGVQKAGTSSYYNWLSQHPEIFAPSAAKDFSFFANDKLYIQGEQLLESFYTGYSGQKIVMQGHINNIFFPKALQRIKSDCASDVKLILILRDPVKRTISSYKYTHKLGMEDNSFDEAIKRDMENYYTDYMDVKDKTYVAHSLYYKQITELFKVFKKEQVQVIIFEDMIKSPASAVSETFKFLNVDASFVPDFKLVNETGAPRFRLINKFFFKENKFKNLVKKSSLFNMIFPYNKRMELRKKITQLNTTTVLKNEEQEYDLPFLYNLFKDDIQSLEKLLGINLNVWKKYGS